MKIMCDICGKEHRDRYLKSYDLFKYYVICNECLIQLDMKKLEELKTRLH